MGARGERDHFQDRLHDEHRQHDVAAQIEQVAVLSGYRGGGSQAQNKRA